MSEAQRIFESMDAQERDVFGIVAQAAADQNQELCDGVVCMHFVTKRLMGMAGDGFVVNALGLEVARMIRAANPELDPVIAKALQNAASEGMTSASRYVDGSVALASLRRQGFNVVPFDPDAAP